MQIRRLIIQPTLFIHHHNHSINNNCILYGTRRLYIHTSTTLNMGGRYGRGGRGNGGRGRNGGRSGGGRGGGYDWKKHIRPSTDPAVQVSPR